VYHWIQRHNVLNKAWKVEKEGKTDEEYVCSGIRVRHLNIHSCTTYLTQENV
jgi:hypothetical protein